MFRTILVAGALLLLAGAAQAATLTTAPMLINHEAAVGRTLECAVVNVSNHNVEVRIENELDNIIEQGPVLLAPGEMTSVNNTNFSGGILLGFCTFDVPGSKHKVRASGCFRDVNHNCRAALAAE